MRCFEILSLFSAWLMILMAAEGTSGSGKLARFIYIGKKYIHLEATIALHNRSISY